MTIKHRLHASCIMFKHHFITHSYARIAIMVRIFHAVS